MLADVNVTQAQMLEFDVRRQVELTEDVGSCKPEMFKVGENALFFG